MSELKPCPLCGVDGYLQEETYDIGDYYGMDSYWYIEFDHKKDCLLYENETKNFDTKEDAIKACNKRQPHPAIQAVYDKYKESGCHVVKRTSGNRTTFVLIDRFRVEQMLWDMWRAIKKAVENG